MAQEPEPTAKRAELPMRLTRLRVKNFRSIADIDIPLSPLTVLVGPNGSGKSNVVDALRFVRDVFARGLDQAVMDREGMGVIQRWGTEGITIGVTIELEKIIRWKHGEPFVKEPSAIIEHEFLCKELDDKKIVIKNECVRVVLEGGESFSICLRGALSVVRIGGIVVEYSEENFDAALASNQVLQGPKALFSIAEVVLYNDEKWVSDYMPIHTPILEQIESSVIRVEKVFNSLLFYTLNPADLRQPQQILKEMPFDEKGRNLAAVLRKLSRDKGDNWGNLRFALRQTIAGFDDIAIETVGGYLATQLVYQTDHAEIRTSYLGQESDGTIRMLGLLAALQQEPSQPLVCIEEPEANIHPGALAVLAGVIDEASLRSQILVTTHSPDMLDHLPVESFLVVEKVGDTTHVGTLDASQIASVRKRLFTPGELFRMEGLQRQTESAS